MKRIVILTIIALIIISSLNCHVYAEEAISYDDAYKLVCSATDIRKSVVDLYVHFDDYTRNDLPTDIFNENNIRYRLVSDGYGREQFENRINDTFSQELAKKCLCSSYFNYYLTKDGKDYYQYTMGAQVTPNVSTIYYTEDELKTFKLIGENIGVLTAEYKSIWSDYRKGTVNVYFTFVKENGQWKISELDESEVIFRQTENSGAMTDLTESSVKTALAAVINDLYFITRTGGHEVSVITGGDNLSQNGSFAGKNLSTLGDESAWREYALKFCSKYVADEILESNRFFVIDGANVYVADGISSNNPVENMFDDSKLNADNVKIVSQTDTNAIVQYEFSYLDYTSDNASKFPYSTNGWKAMTLTIEFENQNGTWVITGGDFIQKLDEYFNPLIQASSAKDAIVANISTGDENVFLFIIAAITILLILIKQKNAMSY